MSVEVAKEGRGGEKEEITKGPWKFGGMVVMFTVFIVLRDSQTLNMFTFGYIIYISLKLKKKKKKKPTNSVHWNDLEMKTNPIVMN